MSSRLILLLAFGPMMLGVQLACTNDPPPSTSLREHGHPPVPADPHDLKAAIKRGEVKLDMVAAEPPSPNVPEGLELLVEQCGPAPFPHQSVRLRLILKNTGKQAVNQLRLLEPAIVLTGVKGPNDQTMRWPLEGGALRTAAYTMRPRATTGLGVSTPLATWCATEHLSLQPGEQVTVSGAFGPWHLEDGIFEQPGDYSLQLVYSTTNFRLKAKPFIVRVAEPAGDEANALKLLTQHKDHLGAVLIALRTPNIALSGATVPLLGKLIQQYPKSTYADYARLALARSGATKQLPQVDTKQFALAPDVLLAMRANNRDNPGPIDKQLKASYYDSCEWTEFQANHLNLSFNEWLDSRRPPAEHKKP